MEELLAYELPHRVKNISGITYGRLTAITLSHMTRRRGAIWWFRCACGRYRMERQNPGARSCGCLNAEVNAEKCRSRATHNMSNTRLANIFADMRARCYNTNAINYERYGGNGITICKEWLADRSLFYRWALSNGYEDSLQIDWIDNSRGYEPNNCRWVTATQYQNNRTNNRILKTNSGEQHTLADWARTSGLGRTTIKRRLKDGWTEHDAVMVPATPRALRSQKRAN